MTNFFQTLFIGLIPGLKKKLAMELYAKAAVQLTGAYQDLVKAELTKKDSALINMRVTGGVNLIADLSPQGVEYLVNNLPLSVTDMLRKTNEKVLISAGAIASAIIEKPSVGKGLNPTITELVWKSFRSELRRRFPAWPI